MKKLGFFLSIASLSFFSSAGEEATSSAFPEVKQRISANLGPGCRIAIGKPEGLEPWISYDSNPGQGGMSLNIENPKFFPGSWSMNLACYSFKDGIVTQGWATPGQHGDWLINNVAGANDDLIKMKALRLINITNKDWAGWVAIADDTIGEEIFRERKLHYCLILGAKAVCGHSTAGYLDSFRRNQRSDLTPHIIRLLRGVEFLPDLPP